ncbi:MAG: twin-arginine translocase subunit TatB [Magnetovibrio sp.]|nr:twin-arginine translocase subunit TatB [Magnetovibrio sp.]|tara:strand:- start:978 stop:1505 length:528 start_codon:yes stop_codon:yes gene_type:complete
MFDIGWQEILVLAVIAIIVIGPKDLPRAIKVVTQWIKKARFMARDLQEGLDDMVREAELDEIKSQANKFIDGETFDPAGTITGEFEMDDFERDWSETVEDLKNSTDPESRSKKKEGDKSDRDHASSDLSKDNKKLELRESDPPSNDKLTQDENSLFQKRLPSNADNDAKPEKGEG